MTGSDILVVEEKKHSNMETFQFVVKAFTLPNFYCVELPLWREVTHKISQKSVFGDWFQCKGL